MKIAFFGTDLFGHLLDHLRADGHNICRLYTCAPSGWNSSERIRHFAANARIPACFHRPRLDDIESCAAEGVELMLAAAYPYRIPGTHLIRGINVHPTMLPFGRGASPLPWLIMRYPDQAAVTLHKLTDQFDSGDILVQQPVRVDPMEDMESLSGKLQLALPGIVARTLRNLDRIWAEARPQAGPGSYWPEPTDEERTLRGELTVEENLRIVRAFGNFGARAILNGTAWSVSSASGWQEQHALPLGSVAHRTGKEAILAVKDGFLVLRHLVVEPKADAAHGV